LTLAPTVRDVSRTLGRHILGSTLLSEIKRAKGKKSFTSQNLIIRQRNKSSSEKAAPHKAIYIATQKKTQCFN